MEKSQHTVFAVRKLFPVRGRPPRLSYTNYSRCVYPELQSLFSVAVQGLTTNAGPGKLTSSNRLTMGKEKERTMQKNYRKEEARARFFNNLMGVQEAADYKGRHNLTVRNSLHAGTLAGHQVGFYYVIPRYAVDQWSGSSKLPEGEAPMTLRPQEQDLLDDLITSRQAAHVKGVAESSVIKAIKRGRLT